MCLIGTFETHRSLLFATAYRMLGSAADAEDIVQETYLRFQAAAAQDIRSPRAYLCTIVTRLCLGELNLARRSRECYLDSSRMSRSSSRAVTFRSRRPSSAS
jgi:RNA polymerase sigma-70 factor, ECF subfamily